MMVGRQLGSNVNADAWRFVLKGDMLKDTMEILLWSYTRLPAHLQRCFAFCSLFPKGHEFEDSDLVHLWMAEGFIDIPDGSELSSEDMGRQYFHDLLTYSFFPYHPSYSNLYVIQDLSHDLAERVSKDDCFRIEGDHKLPVEIPATVLHVSITTDNLAMHIPNIGKMGNLRTMIIFYRRRIKFNYPVNDLMEMFKKLRRLRVLSWRHFPMEELPSSIGCLKHLRYLNLSWSQMKKLPESLCKLYHLHMLYIDGCNLDGAPEGLNNLISLKHLDVHDRLISMIPEIGKLTSLQTLGRYHVQKKQGYEIGQLKSLSNLRGELHILNLENVKDEMEAAGAKLEEKKHLDRLILQWGSSEMDGMPDKKLEVLEGLEPHPNLKELQIIAYRGVRFANWVLDNPCLCELFIEDCPELMEVPLLCHSIRELVISNCPKLMDLPSLPHSLNKLRLSDCPKLMEVSPFPDNLEELYIKACPGIETLMSEGVVGTVLPSPLRELTVIDCFVSSTAMFRCLQKFTSLSYLKVSSCPSRTSLFLNHRTMFNKLCVDGSQNLTSLVLNESDSALLPPSLQNLRIESCGDLDGLPLTRWLRGLTSLSFLRITGFSHLQSLGDLSHLRALRDLNIERCPQLTSVGGGLKSLASLRILRVSRCPKLATGRGGAGCLSSVKWLTIDEPLLLGVLLKEEGLNSLQELEIEHCPQGIPFTPVQEEMFQHLTSLADLRFSYCGSLPSLPVNLEKLSSLRRLWISKCPKIKSLPNLPAYLELLMIFECHPQLTVQYQKGGPLRYKIDHIRDVDI